MDLTGISEELDGICREAMLNREHSPWGTPAATVADHVAQILMAAAEDVGQIAARFADGGADGFGASEEGRAADNTLELLRKNLIDTARGVRYGSGYDLEMVDMRCAWVFHFGVQWAVSFQ
jgi:hypothetical protein